MSRPFFISVFFTIASCWNAGAVLGQCEGFTYPDDCPGPPDQTGNCGCDWFEDFESYDLGVMPRVNGWEEWRAADPQSPDLRGIVTDEIADHTTGSGQCLKIETDPGSDQVRRFYGGGVLDDKVGYDIDINAYWIFEAWIFVPNAHTGDSYFALYSIYEDGSGSLISTPHARIEFNSNHGKVWNDLFSDDPPVDAVNLVKGAWSKVRMEMNFMNDVALVFYDDAFLGGYQWAEDLGHDPETLFLGAMELVNGAGTAVYWDDFSLAGPDLGDNRADYYSYCDSVRKDENGCATFRWFVRNWNDDFFETIDEFYIDIEAGEGGRDPACIGSPTGTQAITPPPGWSVENCTSWQYGHAMFRLTADTPDDAIPPNGGTLTGGFITVDANKSREWVSQTTGAVIPPFTVRSSAAFLYGNENFAVCDTYNFSFGPTMGGAQSWSGSNNCVAYRTVPATSDWARLVLTLVLVVAGTGLIRNGRRGAIAHV